MLFKNILWGLCCVYALEIQAQGAPRLRNFQPADYEAQNQNWSLTQSPEGWIYAGNNGALLEFDGTRWRHFPLPEKQAVRAVATGRSGEIFCGGFAEFGYWSKDGSGQLVYNSLSTQLGEGQVSKEEIWHILVLPDYVLFQSFSTLYKFDYQKVIPIKPPNAIMFAQAVNGLVIVPVIERGLYELLPDNTFRELPGSEVLKDKIVQFLVPNGRGGIWAGTSGDGIFELQAGICRPWSNPLNAAFRKNQLNKALALRAGGWAFGTILGGAYILHPSGQLRCHLHRENGLQNNTVLALLEDRDDNLWVGLDRGIDFAVLHSPLTFFTDQTGKIGTVYTTAVHQGQLYIGTNQGVFKSPYPPPLIPVPFTLVEGSQGQVWQLEVFDNQLICGHNSGTFLVEGNNVRRISSITGGWCAVQIPGRPNTLLQATYTGLALFEKKQGDSWAFVRRVGGFSEPLKKIVFDETGNLWGVHPNKGLFRLRLSDDLSQLREFKTFTRDDGLPTDFQLDLCVLPDSDTGIVVVSMVPNALRIQNKKGLTVFEPLPARKWIPGSGGEKFALDSSGLWLYAKSGARQKIPLALVPNFENVEILPGGDYLFCLENGFTILSKDASSSQTSQKLRPSTVVRMIKTADNQTVLPLEGLTFSYRNNNLEFQFAQPFFEHPTRFSWFLEGFSRSWSPWAFNSEKEFTNLPAGRYTFRVRSEAGGEEAMFRFSVRPPWYRSIWAIGAYVLILLALLWLLEVFNRRRLKVQRHRLEDEKEREILILEVENKNRELSNAAFNLIRKNEALQSLKDNLLDSKNEPRALSKIVREIDAHLEGDHDWEIFEESFNRVHDDFFKRLMQQFPDLTPGDLRLAAYLKMNLSSKEIAPLLNISIRGIENKRYRLRKKLGLSEEANLTEFIMAF
ncbi:MAG: two-component regulator propeller domain-containing protein [Saprospiraceae bacterium]